VDWNWGDLVSGVIGLVLGWLSKVLHGKTTGQ
jgi:hypothetical protein